MFVVNENKRLKKALARDDLKTWFGRLAVTPWYDVNLRGSLYAINTWFHMKKLKGCTFNINFQTVIAITAPITPTYST